MKKVYIGIGHGGRDPGACANNLRESDLNLNMGFLLQAELQRCGVDTKISRTSDVDFPTASKVVDANNWGADLVVDLHHNAGGGIGFEIYRSVNFDGSEKLAQAISHEMDVIGRKNRGVKTKLTGNADYFGIIRETKAPAVLIEYGFVDNTADAKLIASPDHQQVWAEATAMGICAILGIDYIDFAGGILYWVQVGAFQNEENARNYLHKVREMGLDAFLVFPQKDTFFRVRVEAFRSRENAEDYLELVKAQGLDAFLVEAAS